jgi:uncharacterized protein involved in outer membrane biogenesis
MTAAVSARAKNIFIWLAVLLLLLGSIAFTSYRFLTSPYASQKAVSMLSSRLGREFSIDGSILIDWNRTAPRIRLFHVRIANSLEGAEPYFVDIDEIDMRIRAWKLLLGRTEIPSLHVIRPRLNFERRDEKRTNWDFPALSGGNITTEIAVPDERADMPLIDSLRIEGGKITYKNIPRKLEAALDLNTAQGDNGDVFVFRGSGKMEGKAFLLDAEGGSLELLRDTSRDFPLKLDLSIGKTKFSVKGTFADPIQLKKLDAMLNLSGPNLADLFYLMHIPFPPTPSYDVRGHLKKEKEKWRFSGFAGRLGHSDLAGNVVYDTEGERPLLFGTVRSRRLDVADLGGLIGLPQHKGEKKASAPGKLLPDTPLELKRLRAGDMNLKLTAAKLNAPGWPLSDMETHIRLKAGMLNFDPLRFGLAGGTVNGRLSLDGRRNTPVVSTDVELQELNIKRFFGKSSFADFTSGQFSGQIQLQGAGLSLADTMAVSNGRVVVTMNGGQASLLLVEGSDLDIAEILPLFFGKDRTTKVRCAVGDFPVAKGLLTSRIFIFDTNDTNIKGSARINLKGETIEAALNARPKDLSLLSLQSRIRLSGKFSNPHISIDPVPLALRGAAAVALGAILPPAALLPFVGVPTGEDADCGQLLRETRKPLPKAK